MVQIDTSEHDWFEGRGERAVLITLIDDATGRVTLRFFEADDTPANMTCSFSKTGSPRPRWDAPCANCRLIGLLPILPGPRAGWNAASKPLRTG